MAIRVLEETGLLPHLNPGVMSWEELNRLKPVSPSMGMMLETTSRRLFEDQGRGAPRLARQGPRGAAAGARGRRPALGPVHHRPARRDRRDLTERAETIFALRATSRRYGAVQEVIVQNFRAKPDTAMRHADDLGLEEYRAAIAVTRLVLGPKARVQAPPNLVEPPRRSAGRCSRPASTTGAASPRSPPTTSTPSAPGRRSTGCASSPPRAGFELRARLTVHPEYVRAGRALARPAALRPRRRAGRPTTAWPVPASARPGGPGRSPTAASAPVRPHRPAHRRSTPTGRTADRRCDFDAVYGDWDELRRGRRHASVTTEPAGATRTSRPPPARAAPPCGPPSATRADLSDEHALTLMTAEGELLDEVCRLADDLRREAVGDDVTYVVNRNINFTNVCYVGCRFCAFAQRRTDADAFSLSLEQVADRAEEAWDARRHRGLHAGRHRPRAARHRLLRPRRGGQAARARACTCTPSPRWRSSTAPPAPGLSIEDFLIKARESGLDIDPGHRRGDPRRRRPLGAHQGQAARRRTWIEVVTTAHRVGLRSSSTMMYGHVDNPRHWVQHLRVLAGIQDPETGVEGFTEFVPLPFVHTSAPIYLAGVARPGPTLARQPRRPRAGPDHAARPDPQHPDVAGSSSASTAPGRCSAPAPTTSAAR